MKTFFSEDLSVSLRQKLLTSGIGPRPIALVATQSKSGILNLSPFSFFNAFGANPPVLAFSPARKGRDASLKDTYNNLMENPFCTVSIVNHDMVEQISLASAEFPPEVDEFIKSGLNPLASERITIPGVNESFFWMECQVIQIIPIGESNGSANIVIAEILAFHVDESKMLGDEMDPHLMQSVGRYGANYYVKAYDAALFEVSKPVLKGIGFEALPSEIRHSHQLTGNHLARLASLELLPTEQELILWRTSFDGINCEDLNLAITHQDWNAAIAFCLKHRVDFSQVELLARHLIDVQEIQSAMSLLLCFCKIETRQ